MLFGTNGSERMRITSGGRVGIGNDSPNVKLDVYETSNIGCASFRCVNDSLTADSVLILNSRTTTNSTYNHFVCANGNFTGIFLVRDSGNALNTNNSYGGLSDIKLKENIVDASPKLDKLNKVRVVNYNLKDNPNQKLIGVIAQELENIFPSMIEESKDIDKDGNDLGTTTKSVKYSVFVPMLIKAIQEQQAQIEELKAKIK